MDRGVFDDSDSLQEFCDQNLPCEMAPLFPLGEKEADRPDEHAVAISTGDHQDLVDLGKSVFEKSLVVVDV